MAEPMMPEMGAMQPEMGMGMMKPEAGAAPEKPKVKGQWRQKIEASRRVREKKNQVWKDNVSYRKNKVFKAVDDEAAEGSDRVAVPVDWTRTKNKQAQLFFQVPEVKLGARNPQVLPAVATATSALNFELQKEMKVHHTMDEVLGDIVNASGIGFALVGVNIITETVMASTINETSYAPEQLEAVKQQMLAQGQPLEAPVERPVYLCYYARRISPAQAIFPADFTGADWDEAEYMGYDGRIPLAEAKRRAWVDENYEHECADKLESTSDDKDDPDTKSVGSYVRYTELWYRRSVIDPAVKDPRQLFHLVLVEGKEEPVKDVPFEWQKYVPETRQWIGMKGYPVKVCTVTKISDEAIPPSDTEIGRPLVRELNESRTEMVLQRKRSQPMRWYDVNYVDEIIADQLDKGTFQGIIPMNGPGTNAIGEVARANYPRESWEFMQVFNNDLDQAWAMGPNQMGFGTPGDTTAAESEIMATAANVRLDYERGFILRFFLSIAEATLGLMQLFQDEEKWIQLEGPDGQQAFQSWDRERISGEFVFDVRPDAAQRIDAAQKRVESLNLYKLLRRDPLVNGTEVVKNVLMWHGFDVTKAMMPPAPPEPKPATLRYTFKAADLTNPMVVALIQKNDVTPLKPENIEEAKQLMKQAGIPEMPPQIMPVPQPGQDGQLPTPEQVAAGTAKVPTPEVQAQHPGPVEQVEPLNQRYGDGEAPAEG